MELFPGEEISLVVQRAEVGLSGAVTWVATDDKNRFSESLISLNGNDLFATVRASGRVYQVRSGSAGRVFAEELDTAAFPSNSADQIFGRNLEGSIGKVGVGQKSQTPGESRTVDVAVLYTQAVTQRQSIPVFVNNAAAEMNQSFINSGVDANVRIVYYGLSSFTEPSTMDFIPEFRDVSNAMYSGTGDFVGLHALRDDVRADVVLLLVDATHAGNTCGVGWIPSSRQGSPARAYSLTGDTCVTTMRNFTHEIGHNIGSLHDKVLGQFDIPFSYSYGYTSLMPEFRTIMGSLGSCSMVAGCPRINYWSSPSLMYQGVPIGDSVDADMARSHNEWIHVPAAYRTSGDPPPDMPVDIDVMPEYCRGLNSILWWPPASGTVGWYELQASTSSNFSNAQEIYRGPQQAFLSLVVTATRWVRGRACNAEGCSGWKAGDEPAIRVGGCNPFDP